MKVESEFSIPADHPALAGHFPGFPVVPGVVLLGVVLEAIGGVVGQPPGPCQIQSAKFFSPVAPGESLRLISERTPEAVWRFEIRAEGRPVASGACVFPPMAGALR